MIEEFSKKITNKVQAISTWLEDFLEKSDLSLPAAAPASNSREPSRATDPTPNTSGFIINKPFEVTTDLGQLSAWSDGLPSTELAKIEFLFTRLIPYFESGVLFKRQPESWASVAAFQEGIFYSLPEDNPLLTAKLPERPLSEIIKVNSPVLLEDMRAFSFVKNDALSFGLRVHPDFYFVVVSCLPELWLKTHLEQIHSRLLALACDLSQDCQNQAPR